MPLPAHRGWPGRGQRWGTWDTRGCVGPSRFRVRLLSSSSHPTPRGSCSRFGHTLWGTRGMWHPIWATEPPHGTHPTCRARPTHGLHDPSRGHAGCCRHRVLHTPAHTQRFAPTRQHIAPEQGLCPHRQRQAAACLLPAQPHALTPAHVPYPSRPCKLSPRCYLSPSSPNASVGAHGDVLGASVCLGQERCWRRL